MKINTKLVKPDGILYILYIDLEDKELVKVGVTTRDKVEDRVCEILTSIWKRYRIFPKCYVKRFSKVEDVFGKEADMHKKLDEFRYECKHKFSGSTEMFLVDKDLVIEVYNEVVNTT